MHTQTFTIGTESFSQWVKSHKDVEDLTLQGTLADVEFEDFEKNLFLLNLKVLRFCDFHITDHKYDENHFIPFEENVLMDAVDDYQKLTLFQIITINIDRVKNFIFCDGWIFSEDKKTLIHAPENITDYVHPEGVEYIGKGVFFKNLNLKTVTFNNSLIEIGKYGFADCESLCELVLPNSVTKLGKFAFSFAEIEKIKLSENLQEIPDGCFQFTDLEEIIIPHSVRKIGSEAFLCAFIADVIIPEGVEKIEREAFDKLNSISLPSSLKKIAPEFYYEKDCNSGEHPPYIEVHPENPIYYAENGTLYFKETGALALDAPYNAEDGYPRNDGDCAHCCHQPPTTEQTLEVISMLRPEAEAGDAKAQQLLGTILYAGGFGIDAKPEEGLVWLKKSAEQGYTPAMIDLSDIYHEGLHIEVDYDECFRWLLKAAPQSDGRVMNNLASCYEEGLGTIKDLQQALTWYRKAVNAGYFKAFEDIQRIKQQLEKASH